MLKLVTNLAAAGAFLAATTIISAPEAHAYRRGYGVAGAVAGTIIGLGVLGAYAASRDGYHDRCYPGRQRCEVVGQRCFYDRYGEYRCRDDVRCWRPRVCD
ncbi:MAG: hypothetical protein JSS20_13060 [Proteobacteria bacterium]|nr:hypothetical protein [Pseudomonadota bacterium]